jgi:D-lactate dehydrogenase (cytochrome)
MGTIQIGLPAAVEAGPISEITDQQTIRENYSAYLGDESKMRAESAASLCFPTSTAEVSQILRRNFAQGRRTRISGARTGVAGAAVPETADCLVSLEKLDFIRPPEQNSEGRYSIRVGAGVTLYRLNEHLREVLPEYYFPVDPTETWASFGGMAATNASGARSYHYGSTRDWISAATLICADGSQLTLRRGAHRIENRALTFLFPDGERALSVEELPKPRTKNTLGYCFEEGGDALDVFIGSEGTLAVFTELELQLAPVPKQRLYYLQFFTAEEIALEFVSAVRSLRQRTVLAVEFLDRTSLLLASASAAGSKSAPAQLVDAEAKAAVYLEVVYADDEELAAIYEELQTELEKSATDPSRSFAGVEDRELRELKIFRHAVPEHINATIAKRKSSIPELHKIATDMAVPDEQLIPVYHLYHRTLTARGLEFAIFGHAGNNHFHVNILPRTRDELLSAKEAYGEFARAVVELGGAVAAEHGIGRLKKNFLAMQYGPRQLQAMQGIKQFFDPRRLLNTGVLFNDAD